MSKFCGYCAQFHDSPCALALERLDQVMAELEARYSGKLKPNWKPETSNQIRLRAERQRDIATAVKIQGRKVRPEYD